MPLSLRPPNMRRELRPEYPLLRPMMFPMLIFLVFLFHRHPPMRARTMKPKTVGRAMVSSLPLGTLGSLFLGRGFSLRKSGRVVELCFSPLPSTLARRVTVMFLLLKYLPLSTLKGQKPQAAG